MGPVAIAGDVVREIRMKGNTTCAPRLCVLAVVLLVCSGGVAVGLPVSLCACGPNCDELRNANGDGCGTLGSWRCIKRAGVPVITYGPPGAPTVMAIC